MDLLKTSFPVLFIAMGLGFALPGAGWFLPCPTNHDNIARGGFAPGGLVFAADQRPRSLFTRCPAPPSGLHQEAAKLGEVGRSWAKFILAPQSSQLVFLKFFAPQPAPFTVTVEPVRGKRCCPFLCFQAGCGDGAGAWSGRAVP